MTLERRKAGGDSEGQGTSTRLNIRKSVGGGRQGRGLLRSEGQS